MRHSTALESYPLILNGQTYAYHHVIVDLSRLPLLEWLAAQTLYPKVYWQPKGGQIERAAVGSLITLSQVPTLDPQTPAEVRFFGGRQFDPTDRQCSWESFPSCSFWLPEFEIIQESGRTYLVIHTLSEEADLSVMHKLNFEIPESRPSFGSLLNRQDCPPLGQWELLIARALFEIEEELLEKVVLARKTHFRAEKRFDPLLLLKRLQERACLATVFGFQLSSDAAFIGATPELLYRREDRLVSTEALAGTRPRGATEEENLRIQEELLTNAKEKREFALVKQYIQTALAPLSSEMHWDPYDRVVPTTHVQHIYNRLQAILLPEITDEELIRTLHPTPALGGKPRAHALQFLQDQEPFDRGWYGAPIGWISAQAAEIAVGIRSALVQGNELDLFAGTGIVKGSHALKEWEELEHKITPFKHLFL